MYPKASIRNLNTKSTQFIISQHKKGMIRNVLDKKWKTMKLYRAMQVKIWINGEADGASLWESQVFKDCKFF